MYSNVHLVCVCHVLQYMKDHGDAHRSSVTGKVIKLKVKKSTKDKEVGIVVC